MEENEKVFVVILRQKRVFGLGMGSFVHRQKELHGCNNKKTWAVMRAVHVWRFGVVSAFAPPPPPPPPPWMLLDDDDDDAWWKRRSSNKPSARSSLLASPHAEISVQ